LAVYRRSTRSRYVIAVLVLSALTLITLDTRSAGFTTHLRSGFHDAFGPLQRGTHAALQPVGNFFTGAVDYGTLKKENQRLRDEVAGLQRQQVQSAAEQAAAEQVLAEQNLPFVGAIPNVTVEIIDNGSANFENSVTINKGTSSGVAVGQPVVAAGGLVGTVSSVSKTVATVVLLTDPTFVVGVKLAGGNTGSASGSGRGQPLRIEVVTTSQAPPTMKKGDDVVTSGLDLEKFPPNIPVGKVLSAATTPGNSEPDITLAPMVDLSQLTYLQVLLWSPQ
jgi:rod shape-determining protein MreC